MANVTKVLLVDDDPASCEAWVRLVSGAAGFSLRMLGLMVPITAMYWFALPSVVFQGTEPWTAMKQSLSGCLANMIPMLVYGVIALIALAVASIPFFLGLLIVAPVLFASWLISHQDIFGTGTVAETSPITPL